MTPGDRLYNIRQGVLIMIMIMILGVWGYGGMGLGHFFRFEASLPDCFLLTDRNELNSREVKVFCECLRSL